LIVAERKPIDEIMGYLEGFKKIAIAGCGTCVTVCMAGGEKEAEELKSILELKMKAEGKEAFITTVTPKRQCDREFIDDVAEQLKECDCILSMACGAGIQYMAEIFDTIPVLPAVNTKFIGVTREAGIWTEMCQGCGECVLEKTGGICPVTRCSKSNFNGPCGGSQNGKCEIDPDVDCGWQLIYDRLKKLGRLDRLYEIVEPKDWRTSRDGGPRKIVRDDINV
jgi:ferredoxin